MIKDAALLAAGVLLFGCSAPQQVILPGLLDLRVVAGDELKLCPSDGVTDTTPMADCIIGPATDALAPYAKALSAKGWSEQTGGASWLSPEAADGRRRCLTVQAFQTNFTKRDRTLLEFRVSDPGPDSGPDLACQPKEKP